MRTHNRRSFEMSDTVKQEYQDKLGEKFGTVLHGLGNEWAWGRMRTDEFRQLFSSAENVGLLNAISGGGFIWDVQHIFWDDLMLRLCRLTDPPKTGRKDNLTVQKLPEFCEDIALRREVKHCVNTAIEAADFARPWRNQRISHADLDRATTSNVEPLAPATLQQVAAAFDAVHAILNTISVRLLNEEIGNHVVVRPRARAFLCYAKQLVEAVQYIDSFIDPSGAAAITDLGVASAFLLKLGCKPTADQVTQIIELREASRRFK